MQHCVITDVPLGQMRRDHSPPPGGFLAQRAGLHSLIFTEPTSTDSTRARRSVFCDAAVSHISESTNGGGNIVVTCEQAGRREEFREMAERTEDLVRLPEAK